MNDLLKIKQGKSSLLQLFYLYILNYKFLIHKANYTTSVIYMYIYRNNQISFKNGNFLSKNLN